MSMVYDTHMDFMSADVDMGHTWFDAEAPMEDDQAHYSDHASTQSVEVDMDGEYLENEYEMADEELYEEMSGDLVDIEVLQPSEASSLPPALPLDLAVEPTEPLAPSPLPPTDADLLDATADSLSATAQHGADEAPSPLQDADSSVVVEELTQVVDSHPTDEVESGVLHETTLENDGHEEGNQASAEEESVVTEVQQSLQEPHAGEEQNGEVDPHEISDGVYIDPPPAILVSFDLPNVSEISLFNQPPVSRSPSPARDAESHQVLLHNRPILYYEPLATVFEALRREEFFGRIANLADSELIFDAYDLQLVISEDNVYTREVSLHDLNVLHDASNITGPLRLRLNTMRPRFIVRYHALQAQTTRQNVVDGDESQELLASNNLNEPQEVHEPQTDNHEDEEETEALQPSIKATSTEETSIIESSVGQPNEEDNDDNAQTEEPEKDASGENPAQGGVDEVEGVPPSAPQEEEQEEEPQQVEELLQEEETPQEEGFVVVESSQVPEPNPDEDSASVLTESFSAIPTTENIVPAGPSKPLTTPANEQQEHLLPANDSADGSYDDESYEEQWDEQETGDVDPDTTWEADVEQDTLSNQSSVTLSSKASKRSIDEVDVEDDQFGVSPPSSPGTKRTRVE